MPTNVLPLRNELLEDVWRLPAKGSFVGISLTSARQAEVMSAIELSVQERRRLTISFLNPNYVMAALRSPRLMGLMNRFDLMLADGWGVVWAARLLGVEVPDRLANDDIGRPLFALAERNNYKVFLFGSAPGVPERAANQLFREFPGMTVVGVQHGWLDVERGHPGTYDQADTDAIIERINQSGADLLLVGLPSPLQQEWVWENESRLIVPVIMTGGSYLDHIAERIDWYPKWVCALRVCWLYRLGRDPRRLWKRYSIELFEFAKMVAKAREAVRQ